MRGMEKNNVFQQDRYIMETLICKCLFSLSGAFINMEYHGIYVSELVKLKCTWVNLRIILLIGEKSHERILTV